MYIETITSFHTAVEMQWVYFVFYVHIYEFKMCGMTLLKTGLEYKDWIKNRKIYVYLYVFKCYTLLIK